ncbi:MAG: endolytic transglycosylase MltG [Chloroflexi bacterium]|nr:endolytic transglycosylase MltG [Chloroflexota bacterium]
MLRAIKILVLLAIIGASGALAWVVFVDPAEPSGTPHNPSFWEKPLLGFYLSLREEELNTPASAENTPVLFTISPGETAATIAPRLVSASLIRDAELFRLLAWYEGADVALLAGEYQLRPNMTMWEILDVFREGKVYEVSVTIPEGWRSEEIAEYLQSLGLVDSQQFLAVVEEGGFSQNFLSDRSAGASLEGYLFPDTYSFPPSLGSYGIIELMLENFGVQFTPEMRAKAEERGMSIHQVVTLASIVEREAVLAEERPLIAGVLLNRLAVGMPLEADATVQYALGYNSPTGTWWSDLAGISPREVDSPYNTYLYPGLPPGPIANPGLDSILAVLDPEETTHYFYYANYLLGDGSHVFAETYAEHLENIARYGQP